MGFVAAVQSSPVTGLSFSLNRFEFCGMYDNTFVSVCLSFGCGVVFLFSFFLFHRSFDAAEERGGHHVVSFVDEEEARCPLHPLLGADTQDRAGSHGILVDLCVWCLLIAESNMT